MKLDQIYKRTRTGLLVELRSANVDEAQLVIDYLRRVCGESLFLLSEAEDVNYTEAAERDYIKAFEDAPNKLMLNAYADGRFVGNASFEPVNTAKRMAHRASLGIAIFQSHAGLGIGEVILQVILEQAKACGFEIMELEVFAKNEAAIHLYKKLGFEERGRIIKAVKYKDGSYDDEVLMQLFL